MFEKFGYNEYRLLRTRFYELSCCFNWDPMNNQTRQKKMLLYLLKPYFFQGKNSGLTNGFLPAVQLALPNYCTVRSPVIISQIFTTFICSLFLSWNWS